MRECVNVWVRGEKEEREHKTSFPLLLPASILHPLGYGYCGYGYRAYGYYAYGYYAMNHE